MITDATERQVRASDPAATTWVAANAGSGKTRVLTDRVARLLLRGVLPQHILCLTYTKAAATEMQNRLFVRLGEWAMKPADGLRKDLAILGEPGPFDGAALANARRLFARALETPGGLRIQTIHSFCATLLRRFPLEAKVSPGFTELDDRAARLLRAQIVEEMALSGAPDIMAEVAALYSGDDFSPLMEQVANNRHGFDPLLTDAGVRALFGLSAEESEARILADVLPMGAEGLLKRVIPVLRGNKVTDGAVATALAAIDFATPADALLPQLEDALLTKAGTKRKKFPTNDAVKALGADFEPFDNFIDGLVDARARLNTLFAARKTLALHRFAGAFLPLYRSAKARRGWLDFDDLIFHAKGLLTDSRVAAWVLYRLDGGIDHILVDEAQDTSPDQWRVIELLSAEFTAGEGAQGNRDRTLFVVGDKKQSIYSFQGADVAAFDAKYALFKSRFEAAGKHFQTQPLQHSFRSAPAILNLVDATFKHGFAEAMGDDIGHLAFKNDLPGRVDLWQLIEPVKDEDDAEWENPVDLISEAHHATQLATKIAAEIARMIAVGTQIMDKEGLIRPVHAGDFLILVQRRSDALFAGIIRACKQANLPIAGADRLKLGAELAVKDLAALLSFLATPEDSLSLAAVLRSPLCGWSEDALFRLAHGRSGYLWESLRKDEAHPETLAMLRDLLNNADFLRPFDLLERVLTRHHGRQHLIARLGDEAEDGIDELLSQALSYERSEVPSLTGFLIWLETDDVLIKRQMDSAGQRIRVMTVHGAKGLEAPIVILPDTADHASPDRGEIYRTQEGVPLWRTASDRSPAVIQALKARRKAGQDAERARLLYVALTRAQCWLIVAGAGSAKSDKAELAEWSWYRLVEKGMDALGPVNLPDGRRRLETGAWPADVGARQTATNPVARLPDWALSPVDAPQHPPATLSPSDLGGAKAVADAPGGPDDPAAKARGTAIHRLLEHLPGADRQDWSEMARALVGDPVLCADALAEATTVLSHPDLQWIFAADSLAEATITAPFKQHVVLGSVDRLIISPDCIRVVDFKSNAVVPQRPDQVPDGILRQMGAYADALAQVYPGRRIETAILWTSTATLMPLDPDIVSAALDRATIP